MGLADEFQPPSADMPMPHRVRSRLADAVDRAVAALLLGHSMLGREMGRFSRLLEQEVLPAAREGMPADSEIGFETCDEGGTVVIAARPEDGDLRAFPRLGDFLARVGVRSLVLDSDLESNQVYDVLRLIWCVRRVLTGWERRRHDRMLGHDAICDGLEGENGIHVACAQVRLDPEAGRLTVRNSYCPLTFSRAVTAYMQRVSRFHDHRAFFYAAPRYALVAALATLVAPAAMLLLGLCPAVVIGVGLAVALVAGAGTLIVFETIGAVQYDKEYQARQLERRHEALIRLHESVQTDLTRARRIQRAIVPGQGAQPFADHVLLAHTFVPEMAVGGDYYDFRAVDENRLAIVLADVSGHGMSGAFVTGIIKTAFDLRELADEPTARFVEELNRVLVRLTPPDSFAAVVFAVYDVERHILTYVNAGHNPLPMVVRRRERRVESLDAEGGLVAGVDPDRTYPQTDTPLEPGDKFVICTDGIIEGADVEGNRFGLERLKEQLVSTADRPALVLPDHILRALADHMGDAPQNDDHTIVVMEVLR
jgi:serine phosphatase RsbU (regulator of sigma subunit)